MIFRYWQLLFVIINSVTCVLATNIYRTIYLYHYEDPSLVHYNYAPLYVIKGPDPMNDYFVDHFRPKKLVKRIQRRQVDEDSRIKDLLDSFGGPMETSPSDKGTKNLEEAEVMPNQKSGFYYLLDWNSFFELDNQNGRKVNLRIQPKFGDPKRFFSVSVP